MPKAKLDINYSRVSWLDKKKRGKIGKTTSQNEIARIRPSENAELTAKMENFIRENPGISTIERV
ncbi:hypothetical protein AC1031_009726 [Aphanomyces cochlioides]|nr:hypothetical protein AC1031_009726 [Aphanomyces cochlioides]